jgi:thiamine biosynthesis lipoprotein
MGGRATISLVGSTAELLHEAFGLADRCEQLWSRFIASSDVSHLNWAEGSVIGVDALTVRLIGAMRDGAALTRGAFDPTLMPDVIAAGYAASIVDESRVSTLPASAASPGDLAGVVIDGNRVRMPVGTTIDPGGVGKGLTADLVCEFAMANGAWGVMAEICGDVVVAGEAPDGVAWRLGVENPFDTAEYSDIRRLARGAIVTSSQRKRRFMTPSGEKHHLIDPRTHDSAVTDIQTVTVIAATGARAETLTKPGFLWNPAEYLDWLPRVGAAGLLVDNTGAAQASENWSRYA